MKNREFKDAVFEQFALVASAFAAPKRIEIIDLLAQGERSVESLAQVADLTHANASRHLQILKFAHLVQSRSQGKHVLYRLAAPTVLRGYKALQALAGDRLAEIERLVRDQFGDSDEIETVSSRQLLERMESGDVVVVDVRPKEEFDAGHIAGALSIPLAELPARLAEIPKTGSVVAYCRGPYCVLAPDAAKILSRFGYKAGRMAEGYPEWSQGRLPAERSNMSE